MMEPQMDYILNFDKVDKRSLPLVGGKNASLGEMIKTGIRVPPGFAVTTDGYLDFLNDTGIKDKIHQLLTDINPDDVGTLNKGAEQIRNMIERTSMSDVIQTAIQEGYFRLCERCFTDQVPVAIRSSATAEDLPTASFAGQQETYLWIQGADQLSAYVQKCWSSLFTPRAISYRVKNNFPHEKVLISVGIQKMVNAKTAGVMFTINPTDGDPSKVVIEGSWGLGETVVSGSVNPDKFVVDKVIMEASEKTISSKHIECIFDPDKGTVVDVDVDPTRQDLCCLEDAEMKALAKMGKEIEAHYGCPMDIEWAIDKDIPFSENMFIVQARPETVWSQRKAKSVIGKKSGMQLLMEQAMKRIKIPG